MEPHLADGLEFRAVMVAACDDEVIPLQARIEAVADIDDVYNTERYLLYVACTRARESTPSFREGYPLVGPAILAERCSWSCEHAREAFEAHDPWSELV